MTINGIEYVEAPETDGCEGCEFSAYPRSHTTRECDAAHSFAFDDFGGNCADRRVIYLRADTDPSLCASESGAPFPAGRVAGGGFYTR